MQGESLSPFLFAIFCNDMERHFQLNGLQGVTIGNHNLLLLLYADDAVIMSDTPHGLQTILN